MESEPTMTSEENSNKSQNLGSKDREEEIFSDEKIAISAKMLFYLVQMGAG